MNKKRLIASALTAAALIVVSGMDPQADEAAVRAEEPAGKRELDDAQLDQITAGTAAAGEGDEMVFSVIKRTRSGNAIAADGKLKILNVDDLLRSGQLTLTDYAQQNLQSIVNINAVNADVNVLLNLNVTIDSTVGTVNQFNLQGALPRAVQLAGQ